MSGEEFLLKWNDHHNSFFSIMQDLCSSETLTDVTLACGGQLFEAHKLMLCVCSSFFRSILARPSRPDRAGQHPIVFLKDVQPQHLEQLLTYMYQGEINVLQEDLAPLIEAARCLQIKGLADAPAGPNNGAPPTHHRPPRPPPLTQPPHMKKAARLNHLSTNKRKTESPRLTAQPPPSSVPSFTLPTEPVDQSEVMKEEQVEMWTGQSDPDVSQSGSDYEMYQDKTMQGEDDDVYQGSQGVGGVTEAAGTTSATASLVPEHRLRYRCAECGKGFITPSKLQRHSYSHTGLRPFHCDVCGKSFSQTANLKTHIKNTHPETLYDNSSSNSSSSKQQQQQSHDQAVESLQ